MTDSQDPWYAGAAGWTQLSMAFLRSELVKPDPDYRSLADQIASYPAEERHAVWVEVAQSASSRAARTRAYLEALHNDPDPASVAWGWLDGDFDLMDKVEHVIDPADARTLATVEECRERLGSIIEAGGHDLPVATDTAAPMGEPMAAPMAEPMAEPMAAPMAEPMGEPMAAPMAEPMAEPSSVPEQPAPAQAQAGPMAEPSSVPMAVPMAELIAEPISVSEQPAPAQAYAQPDAQSPAAPTWSPTHFVPMGGLPAWDYPDPNRQPIAVLNARLGLVVDAVAGDWALVRAVNGWRGWVDGRRLTGPG
jgi:hypothetical protein